MIKIDNERSKSGKQGGNKKQVTYRVCECCAEVFGPLKTLMQRFCSKQCGYDFQSSKLKKPKLKMNKKARYAHRRIRYLVECGKIERPADCQQCGTISFIEAAHYNYNEPEKVKWLCRSCHRKWDKAQPKYSGKEAKFEQNGQT